MMAEGIDAGINLAAYVGFEARASKSGWCRAVGGGA